MFEFKEGPRWSQVKEFARNNKLETFIGAGTLTFALSFAVQVGNMVVNGSEMDAAQAKAEAECTLPPEPNEYGVYFSACDREPEALEVVAGAIGAAGLAAGLVGIVVMVELEEKNESV